MAVQITASPANWRKMPPETEIVTEAATEASELAVVLTFSSVDEYRAMGADIAIVRASLGLPSWATPTEVIAAALRAAL